MFGNNLDVLPRDEIARGGGYMGAGGGGRLSKGISDEQIVGIELCLELAILEDGHCVGPDESGLFESLTEALERQREHSSGGGDGAAQRSFRRPDLRNCSAVGPSDFTAIAYGEAATPVAAPHDVRHHGDSSNRKREYLGAIGLV